MRPAQQGFHSLDAAGLINLRLNMQRHLVPFYRLAQIGLHAGSPVGLRLHDRVEELQVVAPTLLGFVHGQFGALEQLFRVVLTITEHHDADAGGGDVLNFIQ